MQIVSSPLFIRLVDGFIKEHMNAAINENRLTQLYSAKGEIYRKNYQVFPAGFHRTQVISPKIRASG